MTDIPREAEANALIEQTFDASDPLQVNNARKKAGRKKREDLDFIQGVMSLAQGRKWVYEFLKECDVYGNPIVQGDTHATYFNLGKRNIGQLLLQDVQQFDDYYLKMLKEARERQQ